MGFKSIGYLILLSSLQATNSFASWTNRSAPGPEYGQAECWADTTTEIPYKGGTGGLGNFAVPLINPANSWSDPLYLCPGSWVHFDADGGGDCDIVSATGCINCSGRCVRDRNNSGIPYEWTVSDTNVALIEKTWGYRNEFTWVKTSSDLESASWFTIQCSRDGLYETTSNNANDPYTTNDDYSESVVYLLPGLGEDFTFEPHVDSSLTRSSVASWADNGRTTIMQDDSENPAFRQSTALPYYDVEKWFPGALDNACCEKVNVEEVYDYWGTNGDAYRIIDNPTEANVALGGSQNIVAVHSIMYCDGVYGGVGLPMIAGCAQDSDGTILLSDEADALVLYHEFLHTHGVGHSDSDNLMAPIYDMSSKLREEQCQ